MIKILLWSFCSRKGNLERHTEARHTIDKTFKCIVCKTYFKTQQDLRDHTDTDHPERKYKCNECPSTFTHQRTFNAHINIIHKSSKSHVCKVCATKLSLISFFISHMIVYIFTFR